MGSESDHLGFLRRVQDEMRRVEAELKPYLQSSARENPQKNYRAAIKKHWRAFQPFDRHAAEEE